MDADDGPKIFRGRSHVNKIHASRKARRSSLLYCIHCTMKLPTDPHDNPRLYLREYLEQNDDTLWTLLAFDKALVAKYPGITKKTAHAHVRDDMEVLKKLYPESTRIRHRITAIEKELKKKNDTISKFFTDLKPTFETAMLTKEVSQATLEAESLGLAASVVRDIRRKRDVDSSPIQTANKRHMAVVTQSCRSESLSCFKRSTFIGAK
ncbi:hypothetical protein BJV82DRAFT_103098 [Fennellomyces sp. T-0311]|nr:hypothetical protein BJV82DRAFT_103098 [Fennellomyces sp. T-0311]